MGIHVCANKQERIRGCNTKYVCQTAPTYFPLFLIEIYYYGRQHLSEILLDIDDVRPLYIITVCSKNNSYVPLLELFFLLFNSDILIFKLPNMSKKKKTKL